MPRGRRGWFRPSARRAVCALVVLGSVFAGVFALQVAAPSPASASSSTSGEGCPPACGKVAAGDPLLIPYVTVNPGVGWLAAPSSEAQSYVDDLKRNLARPGQTRSSLQCCRSKMDVAERPIRPADRPCCVSATPHLAPQRRSSKRRRPMRLVTRPTKQSARSGARHSRRRQRTLFAASRVQLRRRDGDCLQPRKCRSLD